MRRVSCEGLAGKDKPGDNLQGCPPKFYTTTHAHPSVVLSSRIIIITRQSAVVLFLKVLKDLQAYNQGV